MPDASYGPGVGILRGEEKRTTTFKSVVNILPPYVSSRQSDPCVLLQITILLPYFSVMVSWRFLNEIRTGIRMCTSTSHSILCVCTYHFRVRMRISLSDARAYVCPY